MNIRQWLTAWLILLSWCWAANAQTTAFTYQGRLTDAGNPANGNFDLQFKLFDTATVGTGTQQGATLTRNSVAVSAGVFTVTLDFGANVFSGANRFLEIGVRPVGNADPYTVLAPRQPVTSTPYAIQTLNAAQLGGVAANQYVQTNDPRLSDARPPTPGSANYIQNTSTQQAASFNISGNGLVGGNVGIGTSAPATKLDVRGNLTLETGGSPALYTAASGGEQNRYLSLLNSPTFQSATGLKAGGVLVSGDFFFANPGKDNLIVRGNTGIGTALPNHRLRISGGPNWTNALLTGSVELDNNAFIGWRANSAGNRFGLGQFNGGFAIMATANDPGTTGSPANIPLLLDDSGNLGVNTLSPDQRLTVNGNASKPGGGSWVNFSDERLKTIKGRYTTGLHALRQLQPLRYEYKADNALGLQAVGEHIGFSAQAVQRVLPEAVSRNKQGYLLINQDPILWTMLNAIKEQQAQIAALRRANRQWRARFRRLEQTLRPPASPGIAPTKEQR